MNRIAVLFLGLLVGVFGTSVAHTQQPPMVDYSLLPSDAEMPSVIVDLNQVRTQLATEMQADPTQIPPVVELSAREAARVCGVSEASLTSADGANECEATTTSLPLAMAVRRDAQQSDHTAAAPDSEGSAPPAR